MKNYKKNLFGLIFLCLVLTKGLSAEVGRVELNQAEIKKLFPIYKDRMLNEHHLIITGKERYLIDSIVGNLTPDQVGGVFHETSKRQIDEDLKNLIELRKPEAHKKSLQEELNVMASGLKATSAAIKNFRCYYSPPPIHLPNTGSVQCEFKLPSETKGCFGPEGGFSIPVSPKTKEPTAVYKSEIETKNSYEISSGVCPD